MVWRTVVIGNPAHLSAREQQLRVELSAEEDFATIPLEDLAVLLLESDQVTLTAPLLSQLARSDVALIVCDEKFTPCGLLTSLGQHSRIAEVLSWQIDAGVPFQKRCWQAVVRRKILNQEACLRNLDRDGTTELHSLVDKVQSGDPKNVEAQAARVYWTKLFGGPFKRGCDDAVNFALNYGYAIIRSAVARGLVARGLTPALGIHHDSKQNAFNLADDFVEPFRPLVDRLVALAFTAPDAQFDQMMRRHLVSVLNEQVKICGEVIGVLRAVERAAASYIDAMRANDSTLLILPEVSYE